MSQQDANRECGFEPIDIQAMMPQPWMDSYDSALTKIVEAIIQVVGHLEELRQWHWDCTHIEHTEP